MTHLSFGLLEHREPSEWQLHRARAVGSSRWTLGSVTLLAEHRPLTAQHRGRIPIQYPPHPVGRRACPAVHSQQCQAKESSDMFPHLLRHPRPCSAMASPAATSSRRRAYGNGDWRAKATVKSHKPAAARHLQRLRRHQEGQQGALMCPQIQSLGNIICPTCGHLKAGG